MSDINLIVVDVQPFYSQYFWDKLLINIYGAIKVADRIVWYYNGSEVGIKDTEEDIVEMMEDYLSTDDLQKIEFIDKSYGFLRNWMDRGECHNEIVETIKLMEQHNIFDSRELEEYEDDDDFIFIPHFRTPHFEFAHICGGSENQCLAEMELLLKARGMRTKKLTCAIY